MAFNPFNIFRRNQRAIFAVITVFIMFTFVLSSGLGGGADFFDWLPGMLNKGKRGDFLCTVAGTKVYSHDLSQLQRQRMIAQRFMAYASAETVQSLQRTLLDQVAAGNPKFKMYFQLAMQNPMFAAGLPKMIADDPEAKEADKNTAKTMEAMIAIARTGGTISAVPNRTERDQIEFLLWDRKAKDLGIAFNDDDVKVLISREFMGLFRDDVPVRQVLQKEVQGFSLDVLFKGLAAEFRVRAAQTALLGPITTRGDHTLSTPPVFDPPYDLFEYFRDKTSPTTYEALAVPAAAFVGQVKETPTDDDLLRLFNSRKDYEPDPSKEEPGFRDPRKVKVEWVSVTGEEPYYQKAAAEWVARAEQMAKSEFWGLAVPVPGAGAGAWEVFTTGPTAMKEPLVYSRYQRDVVDAHKFAVGSRWGGLSSFVMPSDLLDTSIVRAQVFAAATGGGAVSAAGNAFLPASLVYAAAVSGEQRARAKAGVPVVLGLVPGPGLFGTALGGIAASSAAEPPPLPIEAVKPQLVKAISETKARELAVADLRKLRDDVAKLSENGKAKNMTAAKDAVAEFVKARGLKTGTTADFVNEWTIGDDPGLAPLKAVTDKSDPHAGLRGSAPVQFGQRFFWTTNVNPATGAQSRGQATGTFVPEFYPERADTAGLSGRSSEPVFLAWRTAEQAARGLTPAEAKPRVLEAWKRAKARELAKAEAERLAGELRNKPHSSLIAIEMDLKDMAEAIRQRTTDPKVKDRVKPFEISDVAPLAITPDFTGRGGPGVRPFQLTASTNVPYPTPDMTTVLLADRAKPKPTVVVLPDQPKDTYYIFALADRREQTESLYRQYMIDRPGMGGPMGGGSPVRQEVRGAFQRDAMTRAKDSVVGLLKKEYNYAETPEQTKKIDDRDRRSSSED